MSAHAAIKQFQSGDIAGMDVLYSLFREDVLRWYLASVRDYDLAEDMTQDTFAGLLVCLPNFKCGPAKFEGWLYRYVVCRIIDYFRHRDLDPFRDTPAEEADGFGAPHDSDPGLRLDIEKLLNTLYPEEREVALATIEGYTPSEGALRLGIHRNTFINRLDGVRAVFEVLRFRD